MIRRNDLQLRAREWMVDERVVEKDYVIGWLLWGLGTDPLIQRTWAFKGGTSLKKCYLETYRFSEDLDFTVMEDGPILPERVRPRVEAILERVARESGLEFPEVPRWKQHRDWLSTEGRIYYRGPVGARNLAMVKVDLTSHETVVCPTVLRPIAHAYPEQLPPPAVVRCYSFEEVFAEKIRALGERCRPRDLYDVVNLYRRRDLRSVPELLRQVLEQKCATKQVPVPTWESLSGSPHHLVELQAEWENMLAHQLPALPEFRPFWNAVPEVFAWLEGREAAVVVAAIRTAGDLDLSWTPPPTATMWGFRVEPIRFAGANHLCVELGYGGEVRLIEPYSLRRTREGALLLYALRHEDRALRSYRVDRIQTVRVTNQVFQPTYRIEFAATGPLMAPPTSAASAPSAAPKTARGSGPSHSNKAYTVQCIRCSRRFQRTTPSLAIRPHHDSHGRPCSGRQGRRI